MYSFYAELRDKKGLSDYAVAKETGVGRSTLSDWKTGKHEPNTDNLIKIASFLGVSVEYLKTGEDPYIKAHETTERITKKLESLSGMKNTFMEDIQKDKTFMSNIEALFALDDDKKKIVYGLIQSLYYDLYKEKDSSLNA